MSERQSAENDAPHCPTCTCGCTCGYGGLHEPGNPRCALNGGGILHGGIARAQALVDGDPDWHTRTTYVIPPASSEGS